MKQIFIVCLAITFNVIVIKAQNPIKTVADNSNFLGKRFDASFSNLVNISNLDIESFEKYSKELGFDTKPTGSFCIEAFPQCKDKLQTLVKCNNRLIYWWNDTKSEISTLRVLFTELSKQVESYRDQDGFTCFSILYANSKYTFRFKSTDDGSGLNETLLLDND